eukprot:CAMPEP_0201523734 /NCGR_PEP_ID=MMETSP0161_2-20130828/20893_1 /ASSEMBLY_ACC=CAM_ASM_000251 /TAXON_ID=180227 /ORGANISM="Neoparamoeba aestuarina, Strain SoJaBio B1-5/56/2" /LENGTH=339 /DNA_ID=CAMNT_0047922939 /DNA_START=299 /DNA_END=1318 /DNA_ORIENTATION=-
MFGINFSIALDDNRKLEKVQEEMTFSRAATVMLEDISIERGLSLVYLSNDRDSEEFRERLQEQRNRLEKSIEEGMEQMKESMKFTTEEDVLYLVEVWVDDLPDFRDRVDDGNDKNLTISDVMDFYTHITDLLISAVGDFTSPTDGDVAKRAMAWKHMLFEYDNLEKQKSLGSSMMDNWNQDLWVLFVRAGGRVDQNQDSFSFTAAETTWDSYLDLLASQEHERYKEVEEILEMATVEKLGGVGAVEFWEQFSEYTKMVQPFREQTMEDVKHYSDSALDETRSRLITNGIGLGIGIVACVFLLVDSALSAYDSWKKQRTVEELDNKFASEAKEAEEWSPT